GRLLGALEHRRNHRARRHAHHPTATCPARLRTRRTRTTPPTPRLLNPSDKRPHHVRTPTLPAPPHPPTGRTLPGKKKRPQPRRRVQIPLPCHVHAHSRPVLSQPEDVHSQPGLDQSIPRKL